MKKNLFMIFIFIILLVPMSVKATDKDIVKYIKGLSSDLGTNSLAYDDSQDKNLRYVGDNPNNYVKFNNELWRIIGITKTEDGEFVKIVRSESIGKYSLTTSDEWTTSNITKILNEDYYNKLSSEAKSLIRKTTYSVGSSIKDNYKEDLVSKIYTYPKRSTWEGYLGLLYPADYLYASSNIDKCLNNKTWDEGCSKNNYLTSTNPYWTMTSHVDNNSVTNYFAISDKIEAKAVNSEYDIRPVAFLSTNIMITDGNGKSNDPYEIKKYEENTLKIEINEQEIFSNVIKDRFSLDENTEIDLGLMINNNDNVIIEDDTLKAVKVGNSELTASVDGKILILNVDVTPLAITVPDTGTNNSMFGMIILGLAVLIIGESIIYTRQRLRKKKG